MTSQSELEYLILTRIVVVPAKASKGTNIEKEMTGFFLKLLT